VLAEDSPQWSREVTVLVRTAGEPRAAERLVRGAVGELDGLLPVYDVRTMEETVAASLANQEFMLVLLGAFAALALVLASVGIYGVMAYSVANRTREIGIRLALGAPVAKVVGLVVRDGSKLAGLGLGIGLVAAVAASRALGSLLYAVPALDPVTYLAVAVGLSGVALLASYVPARRAVRVDPAVTLRAE
jgi:putative ABC transport system permease protein